MASSRRSVPASSEPSPPPPLHGRRPVRPTTTIATVCLAIAVVCACLRSGEAVAAGGPGTDELDVLEAAAASHRPVAVIVAAAVGGSPKFGDRISPRYRGVATGAGATLTANTPSSTSATNQRAATVRGGELASVIRTGRDGASGDSDSIGSSDAIDRLLVHDRRMGRSSNLHGISNDVTELSVGTADEQTDRIGLVTSSSRSSSGELDAVEPADTDADAVIDSDENSAKAGENGISSDNQLKPSYTVEQNVSAQAHRLEMSTEFFVVPSTAAASVAHRPTTIRPGGVVQAVRPPPLSVNTSAASYGNRLIHGAGVTPPTIISTAPYYTTGLRREPWVVPVLVLAALTMIMMAAFEIFVLCKAWRTSPSRRHLFLGQMLLLGLFACAGIAAIITATPTLLSCATVRFGAGVAYALVFASLLVKCVFLISLNGGVYLPAPYQGLLLLFAVLIQVAIGAQWLLTSPPAMDNVAVTARSAAGSSALVGGSGRYPLLLTAQDVQMTTVPLCRTPFTEVLFSLVYVLFLIVFVAVLAIKSRGIRDNYREATYIGLAIGGSIPIWFAWILCGLAVSDRHKDACLAFGLVATSATVFLVMFMPKGRQLAAMGKEGLYVEDREEQFSSLSRAGSGYSPSFFHFKPIKYGVMGAAPVTTTSTTHTTGNGVHISSGGGNGGGVVGGNKNINNNNGSSNNNHLGSSGKHQQAAAIATLGGGKSNWISVYCSGFLRQSLWLLKLVGMVVVYASVG